MCQRASLYQLDRDEAAEIVDHQIATITESWHDACDRAELTGEQRKALWGRQFLNPGSLVDWADPIDEP